MAIQGRFRNGMTNLDESDIQGGTNDFVAGPGVLDFSTDFITTQDTGSNRKVAVTGGILYLLNSAFARASGVTKYYPYEVSDSSTLVDVDPNTTLATRVDYVCFKFDSGASSDANNTNTGSFVIIKGTSSGVAPTLLGDHVVLSRLDLPLNFTSVTNAMITDMRNEVTLKKKDWNLIEKSDDPLAVGGALAMVQYVSVSSFKIFGNWTGIIGTGVKIKLTQGGSIKYFTTSSDGSYSAGYTTYNINLNGLYTLTNSVITKVYYSNVSIPNGMSSTLNVLPDSSNYRSFYRQGLINGNFNIWQRGTSVTAAGSYFADRWRMDRLGTSTTTSQQSFTVGQTDVPNEPTYFARSVVTTSAGASNFSLIEQRIEDVRSYAGKRVTVSFYAKADSSKNIALEFSQNFGSGGSSTVLISPKTVSLTSSFQKFTVNFSIPSISGSTIGTSSYLRLIFWFDAGSTFDSRTNSLGQQSGTFDISQVQVNEGPIALPFEPRSIAEELVLCHRYYEKSYDLNVNPGTATNNGLVGYEVGTATTGVLKTGVFFKTSKRTGTSMTFTVYDPAGASGKCYRGANGKTASAQFLSENVVTVQCTDTTSATGILFHWVADAEL